MRDFARRAVAGTGDSTRCRHLAMTLHGPNTGLDEREAFVSELAGILDALRRDEWPAHLACVSIVEMDDRRAQRLAEIFYEVLDETVTDQFSVSSGEGRRDLPVDFASAGSGSREKPHVFVAMPFLPAMDDVFYYGIQNSIVEHGHLCERADLAVFLGDIVSWIRARIDSAVVVVADLTGANANVYLEVGYAWGRNIPTVLLVQDPAELKFDLKGQRCIVYSSIRDLETKLRVELSTLLAQHPRKSA